MLEASRPGVTRPLRINKPTNPTRLEMEYDCCALALSRGFLRQLVSALFAMARIHQHRCRLPRRLP